MNPRGPRPSKGSPAGPFTDPEGRKGLWALVSRAPRHRLVRYRVPLASWEGRDVRAALLTDLHLGSHTGDVARLARIVEEVNALAPDVVLLGGDHMNMMPFGGGRIPPRTIAGLLARLAAPTVTVMGNHDWEYGFAEVSGAFEEHGIPVLENAAWSLEVDGRSLRVVGLADDLWGEPDFALAGREAGPEVVLAHDPGIIGDLADGTVLLAGHVHAGQVRLPGLPVLHMPPTRLPRALAHGHHRVGQRHLIVSSGLGASGVPFRLFAPPEVVEVTFTAAG